MAVGVGWVRNTLADCVWRLTWGRQQVTLGRWTAGNTASQFHLMNQPCLDSLYYFSSRSVAEYLVERSWWVHTISSNMSSLLRVCTHYLSYFKPMIVFSRFSKSHFMVFAINHRPHFIFWSVNMFSKKIIWIDITITAFWPIFVPIGFNQRGW